MTEAVAEAITNSVRDYAAALSLSHRGEDRRHGERIHAIWQGAERRTGNDRRSNNNDNV